MRVERLPHNPIIGVTTDPSLGGNINGPSLVRMPEWAGRRLGKYHLYFAHHQGLHIRLAFADRLEGPWRIHREGVLQLADTGFSNHIASPDVHLDDAKREFRMYFHGCTPNGQQTRVALSADALSFTVLPEILGASYFRVFCWRGSHYALGMPGIFYRSADGLRNFERGPTLFTPEQRHTALKLDGDVLSVFYTNAGDCPERILLSRVELTDDWMQWRASEPVTILAPETDYEGGQLPLEPSRRGTIRTPARQLRDPCIYREGSETFLLYAVAGEQGIAVARLYD